MEASLPSVEAGDGTGGAVWLPPGLTGCAGPGCQDRICESPVWTEGHWKMPESDGASWSHPHTGTWRQEGRGGGPAWTLDQLNPERRERLTH